MLKNLINYVKDNDYLIGLYKNLIYISNYEKIIDIDSNMIKIKFKDKNVKINGKNLCVKKMENNEISIDGEYKGIEFYE